MTPGHVISPSTPPPPPPPPAHPLPPPGATTSFLQNLANTPPPPAHDKVPRRARRRTPLRRGVSGGSPQRLLWSPCDRGRKSEPTFFCVRFLASVLVSLGRARARSKFCVSLLQRHFTFATGVRGSFAPRSVGAPWVPVGLLAWVLLLGFAFLLSLGLLFQRFFRESKMLLRAYFATVSDQRAFAANSACSFEWALAANAQLRVAVVIISASGCVLGNRLEPLFFGSRMQSRRCTLRTFLSFPLSLLSLSPPPSAA
jgi:hypothetical protein